MKHEEEILRHTSSMLPEWGYMVRIIESETDTKPHIRYPHRDEYYMMGVLGGGNLDCNIDFQRYLIEAESIIVLTPGQVHRFVFSRRLGFADSAYFSRLFAETVGMSAMVFRRNLDKSK